MLNTLVCAKEQEIEKRKLQVRGRWQAQLMRVEKEARSLDQLRKVSRLLPIQYAMFFSS